MEKFTSNSSPTLTERILSRTETTSTTDDAWSGNPWENRMVAVTEPGTRKQITGAIFRDTCERAVSSFNDLRLTHLEMPLRGTGLYRVNKQLLIGIDSDEKAKLLKPMLFIINFAVNEKNKVTQKIYLQQALTPYVGGHYTPTKGYSYLISPRKSSSIQRLITKLENVDDEIQLLCYEAQRFLYMYCRLDI